MVIFCRTDEDMKYIEINFQFFYLWEWNLFFAILDNLKFLLWFSWYQPTEQIMGKDILKYLPTVMFRGTPCTPGYRVQNSDAKKGQYPK